MDKDQYAREIRRLGKELGEKSTLWVATNCSNKELEQKMEELRAKLERLKEEYKKKFGKDFDDY